MSRPTVSQSQKQKPAKPTEDFPLFAHGNGQWAKKIKGKLVYFGQWSDPFGAWRAYEAWQASPQPEQQPGKTPPRARAGQTVESLVADVVADYQLDFDSKQISIRHLQDMKSTGELIKQHLGYHRQVATLTSADFDRFYRVLNEGRSAVTVNSLVGRVRCIFDRAYALKLCGVTDYGRKFVRQSPTKLAMKQANRRDYDAEEIRKLIKFADANLSVFILLAINTGMGNHDMASLTFDELDLENGWIEKRRQKTGIPRRVPLWPETVRAIRMYLKSRTEPADAALQKYVFITRLGTLYVRACDTDKQCWTDGIGRQFTRLKQKSGVRNIKGRGFYGLRHTFQTIGDQSGKILAVKALMGHMDDSMSAVYRNAAVAVPDEDRLAVTNHIREWLFGAEKKGGKKR